MYLSTMALETTLRKLASMLLAIARASSVLPAAPAAPACSPKPMHAKLEHASWNRITLHAARSLASLLAFACRPALLPCKECDLCVHLQLLQPRQNERAKREEKHAQGQRVAQGMRERAPVPGGP